VVVRKIEQRAADLVSLSITCVEPIQIVAYTKGQRFNLHHDAGTMNSEDNTIELVPPKRLVTFFVYLNDLPIHQGPTAFPYLHLQCQPIRGSAILFCNLLPTGEADYRTAHQACPVDGNLWKYGLNIWIIDESLQELAMENQQKKKIINDRELAHAHVYSYERSAFFHADRMKDAYLSSQSSAPPVLDHNNTATAELSYRGEEEGGGIGG
jgi:hypothetical protein